MSLARIYQGRVTTLTVQLPSGNLTPSRADLASTTSPLFLHHALFQDAVNYYHLCLAALAGENEARPLRKLRNQMKASWEGCEPNAEDRWRARVSAWLGIPATSSFENAVAEVMEGSTATAEARVLAGELLLSRLKGDIREAGRGYLPMFCDPENDSTFEFSQTARAGASGLAKLASILHSPTTTEHQLNQIAKEVELSWTVKVSFGKDLKGKEAKARLLAAVDYFLDPRIMSSKSLAEVINRHENPTATWQDIRTQLAALDETNLVVMRNRKRPETTYATLLFKHFPCRLTADVLSVWVKAPKAPVAKKSAKKAARRTDNAVTVAAPVEEVAFDFAALGDDPIKLARGERGYVFPAFTSLPRWAVAAPAQPLWKEFDIAAFKEALKTVNQFKLKTAERNGQLAVATRRLAYMKGELKEWATGDEEESGHKPPRVTADPNYTLLDNLLKKTGVANEATGGEDSPRRIYNSSLRGFYAIKKDWCELFEDPKKAVTKEALLAIVTEYQQDHSYDIGDVGLFRALCDEEHWPLWKPLDENERVARSEAGFAKDIIAARREMFELEEDVDRLKQPIRFTPAHAEESRRLFMFSDIAGSTGAKFVDGSKAVEVSLACDVDGKLQPVRAKIEYSAPRMARDEIASLDGGSDSSRWLQPMMKALGCAEPEMPSLEKCAVSLMPAVEKKNDVKQVRLLMNFPATLNPEGLIRHIGRQSLWYKQFNGTYKPRTQQLDKGLHLYWPGMETPQGWEEAQAWWNNASVRTDGFTSLSVDLGQREAGAWALLETRCDKVFAKDKKAFITIGKAGGKTWASALAAQGMFRLPGEDMKVVRPEKGGVMEREFYGSAGRNADEAEWKQAQEMALSLDSGFDLKRLGEADDDLSHPEQNGELLRIVGRAQSRLSRFHRWSCRLTEKLAATCEEIIEYGVDEALMEAAKAQDADAIKTRLANLIPDLRSKISEALVAIANRELPLRGRDWVWQRNPQVPGQWQLVQGPHDEAKMKRRIQGQRGLSFGRIEQIEDLRKRFMSLNRAMSMEPEKTVSQGVGDRGRRMDEPCEDILKKLDRLKQQRVNQTAHLILAQALGLRLKPHVRDAADRAQDDTHGEYEVIPGRRPVDFIVLEDLSRYLSSQGRAPSENRKLMKWSHRAVLDKLKQMAEPFGIPVLEVPAAYSSRFCSRTGVVGFRAAEVHDGHAEEFRWKRLLEKAKKDKRSPDAESAALVFEQLHTLNLEARERRAKGEKVPLRTLFVPQPGGPIFIAMKQTGPQQADMNAAINLGLRAIASPACLRARPKIRCEMVDAAPRAVKGNKLEKAVDLEITMQGELTKEMKAQKRTNLFVDVGRVANIGDKDVGSVTTDGETIPVAGGMALWATIKREAWQRCHAINTARIAAWKAKQEGADDMPG